MNPTDVPSRFARRPISIGEEHVRVRFDLVQDEQGYPPATSETLWAVPLGRAQFRLDNIPFFVCGVSCFDIIEGFEEIEGQFRYQRLLKPSGHSTLRVIFFDQQADRRPMLERVQELRNNLLGLGCTSEISHIPGLVSVDVPPDVSLGKIRTMLKGGMAHGLWDYEEATLADSVQ